MKRVLMSDPVELDILTPRFARRLLDHARHRFEVGRADIGELDHLARIQSRDQLRCGPVDCIKPLGGGARTELDLRGAVPVFDDHLAATGISLIERADASKTADYLFTVKCTEFARNSQTHFPRLTHQIQQFRHGQRTGQCTTTALLQFSKRCIRADQAVIVVGDPARAQ